MQKPRPLKAIDAASLVCSTHTQSIGEQTLDGFQTRRTIVLLAGQDNPNENGLYLTTDDGWLFLKAHAEGECVHVVSGMCYADTYWIRVDGVYIQWGGRPILGEELTS